MFDWSISLGNILTIGVMIISVATVIAMLRGQVIELARRMLAVEDSMKKLVDVLIRQGEQHARMDAQDARITTQAQALQQLEIKLDRLFKPISP